MNLRSFTYKDLEEATSGSKEELGRGSFGAVYKGVIVLSCSKYVAIKKLEKMIEGGEREFKTEVTVIGQTHHKNLVRLLGYCDEGEHRILVYEFMYNGSLSSFLFGVLRPSWQQRMQIALGISRGLMYLHEECSMQIIYCDIKPQNILLDDFFTAKISDFGLAKLLMNYQTCHLTGIRGTKGYVAPEWFKNAPITIKVDVYNFGVMLLEIICCKKCVEVETERADTYGVAYDCYSRGKVERLVENDEEAISDMNWAKKLVMVTIWCVQDVPLPSMREVSRDWIIGFLFDVNKIL
nr:g-type lectin s-receptor-like serine/threonine-protein kinase rlk1 [Quercus suber]